MIRHHLASATAFIAVVGMTGCASVQHQPISTEALAKLDGKTVATTQYATPDFTAFTAGKAAFALLGAAAMISEGNEIVKTNGVEDPAIAISAELLKKLTAAKAVKGTPAKGVQPSDNAAALVAANPEAQYILDYKTLNWMFNYYPTDWSHYKVTYVGRLRLIDAATKTVIAESACNSVQGDDKNPPTKDQLLADKAALLKSHLAKAGSACVDVLAKDVLKI
ncbi:hypothetical protein ACG04Q_19630 [Roseateles sp. DXS20W]|uniref:Lipoprotein n=1 Tax=Pelomonas lactea TaxID=3299030 RepID=A0ABW7GPA8_9BURK